MINIIIFSKDRAAQLDLLIRSIKQFFDAWQAFKWNVLYTCSNESFFRGYQLTMSKHPEFNYIREYDFKKQLVGMINKTMPCTLFFVDDNVFKRSFSVKSREFRYFDEYNDKNVLSLTLRLGLNTTQCYTQRRESTLPIFMSTDPHTWAWKAAEGPEWCYPMSVDGGFFHTEDILPKIENLSYQNPNTFEGILANNPIDKPLMVCFDQSVVMNVPANKVQTANANECGSIPAGYLNDNYLQGKQLSINNFVGYINKAPHEEVNFILEDIR